MSRSHATTCPACHAELATGVAKPLGAEDIRPQDYVAILRVTCEIPSFLWYADPATVPPDQPVRVDFIPAGNAGVYKVEAVCLPFVLVKLPGGRRRTFDVRRQHLARLDRRFGKHAWKARKRGGRKRRK